MTAQYDFRTVVDAFWRESGRIASELERKRVFRLKKLVVHSEYLCTDDLRCDADIVNALTLIMSDLRAKTREMHEISESGIEHHETKPWLVRFYVRGKVPA